ncbi:MAG: hypothetical protein NW215_00545 [Hyphomicrobiales bacterium]|nr:hypothetical protein [Hyphomicrobiales bacterium]
MNIPDVTIRDRIIPPRKVLLAEGGAVPASEMAQEICLDTGRNPFGHEVKLLARIGGWVPAGSMLRWDNGAFGVISDRDGIRHGRWFKSFDDAHTWFDKVTGASAHDG